MTDEEAVSLAPLTKVIRKRRVNNPKDAAFSTAFVVMGDFIMRNMPGGKEGDGVMICVAADLATAKKGTVPGSFWVYARQLIEYTPSLWVEISHIEKETRKLAQRLDVLFRNQSETEPQPVTQSRDMDMRVLSASEGQGYDLFYKRKRGDGQEVEQVPEDDIPF